MSNLLLLKEVCTSIVVEPLPTNIRQGYEQTPQAFLPQSFRGKKMFFCFLIGETSLVEETELRYESQNWFHFNFFDTTTTTTPSCHRT